ncbi:MAG: carbohydrate kinase family protein [Ruminococcaceae bacterium]|nr:carbohydrate kinase family protein [Oscillospiraceae bacterium]
MKKIAVIGDALADFTTNIVAFPKKGDGTYGTPMKRNGGGTAANVAVGLGVLGADVSLICRVGDDDDGDFLCHELERDNVDIKGIYRDPENQSGTVLIAVDPEGERSIWVLSIGSAYEKLSVENLKYLDEINPEIIFVSGFMMGVHPAEEAIFEALEKWKDRARIYFDPNLRHATDAVPPDVRLSMQKLSDMSDVVLSGKSEMECLMLTPRNGQTFIVKDGKNGSYLLDDYGNKAFSIAPTDHEAIDATGAGDTYAAAYVYAEANGMSVKESMEFATVASGISVTIPGARSMPSIDLIEKELKKYKE